MAGGLQQLANQVATKALAQPRTQELWEEANRRAHTKFLAVIDDETTAVSTEDGTVTLELGTILASIAAQLGISPDVASKLPPDAGSLEIMQADQLEAAQTAVDILGTLAWVLVLLALIAYALAIYLAGDRRRETLRAAGSAFSSSAPWSLPSTGSPATRLSARSPKSPAPTTRLMPPGRSAPRN